MWLTFRKAFAEATLTCLLGKELRRRGFGGVKGVGNEWAATFFIPVPNGLTTGSSKAAQMSVEEDLARGEEKGGGSYRNTEAARRCDE